MAINPIANVGPSNKRHVFTVALTGGIASGKTLVSDKFASLGVPVVDTDIIARQIVEPGQEALRDIQTLFGKSVIDDDGRLRRKQLRNIIFSDKNARQSLESILHPKIRNEASRQISLIESGYCILVIPLLAESDRSPDINRVLVVDVSRETQVNRLMTRDSCSKEQAELALKSQASRAQRLRIADDVLDNSGSPDSLDKAISYLHGKYTEMCRH